MLESQIHNSKELKSQNLEFIQIKDIKGGEYVLSLNEKTGKIVPAKVKALLDKGVQTVFKLTTESGRTIRTTGNHPYLVKNFFSSPKASQSLPTTNGDKNSLLDHLSSVAESSFNMVFGERRKIPQDLLNGFSSGQHSQNLPDHNSGSLESGLTMTNFRISNDVLVNFDSSHTTLDYSSTRDDVNPVRNLWVANKGVEVKPRQISFL